MLEMPLAYKFVMTAAMVAFVNHYAPRLNLPCEVPLTEKAIQTANVMPPVDNKAMTIYGGSIRAGSYWFTFNDDFFVNNPYAHFSGYLAITKLEEDGFSSFGIPLLHADESSKSLMERASRMKYTVSHNDLHRLATNYVAALEMDNGVFEKGIPLKVDTNVFHSNRGLVPSPLMYAYWGKPELRDPGSNGFAFKISAVSGELLELNVGNASTCRGLPVLKGLDKLLAIPDAEFLKMSSLERSNLVVRFAGWHCPELRFSSFDEPSALGPNPPSAGRTNSGPSVR